MTTSSETVHPDVERVLRGHDPGCININTLRARHDWAFECRCDFDLEALRKYFLSVSGDSI